MAIEARKKKRKLGAHTSITTETSYLKPKYAPKEPPCTFTCPGNIDIRGYLTTISQSELYGRSCEESLEKAWYIITDKNPFPAVCGRVCPHPCEAECNRREKDEAVAINNVERFIGAFGIKHRLRHKKINEESYTEKVAVIGAGPSGLSCAYQLTRRGYPVTVFESLDKAGGMLRYGIPSYRLPEKILDAEIKVILDLGIEVKYGAKIGRDISLEDLQRDFKAIYLAIGANRGLDLNLSDKNAPTVLGRILQRRRIESITKILEELVTNGQAWPVSMEGYGLSEEPRKIIAAIFQTPDFRGLEQLKNENSRISINEGGETGIKGIFAGGDITVPYGMVAQAIGMGRKAAEAIDDYLRGRSPVEAVSLPVIRHNQMNFNHYEELSRASFKEQGGDFTEVDFTLGEVKRCLSCGQCFQCDNCYIFCSDKAVIKPLEKGQPYQFKLEFCKGQECKKCAEECPCGCIDMI